MIFFAMLKKWRFWVFEVDWRICAYSWKNILHIFLRTKYFGVNNQWWSDFDSIFSLPKIAKAKLYFSYLFEYNKCLELLYSPLAGYCFRLDRLLGFTFSLPDEYKNYIYKNNEYLWVRNTQKIIWKMLK